MLFYKRKNRGFLWLKTDPDPHETLLLLQILVLKKTKSKGWELMREKWEISDQKGVKEVRKMEFFRLIFFGVEYEFFEIVP